MKLFVAYNRKNLIDENWVVNKLKLNWKEITKGFVWRSSIHIFDEKERVWVCLSYGYEEKSKKSLFYSSFGIDYDYYGVYYTIHARSEYHCWGTNYPDPWEVICFYRSEIHELLFKSGPRNKRIFNYPN